MYRKSSLSLFLLEGKHFQFVYVIEDDNGIAQTIDISKLYAVTGTSGRLMRSKISQGTLARYKGRRRDESRLTGALIRGFTKKYQVTRARQRPASDLVWPLEQCRFQPTVGGRMTVLTHLDALLKSGASLHWSWVNSGSPIDYVPSSAGAIFLQIYCDSRQRSDHIRRMPIAKGSHAAVVNENVQRATRPGIQLAGSAAIIIVLKHTNTETFI